MFPLKCSSAPSSKYRFTLLFNSIRPVFQTPGGTTTFSSTFTTHFVYRFLDCFSNHLLRFGTCFHDGICEVFKDRTLHFRHLPRSLNGGYFFCHKLRAYFSRNGIYSRVCEWTDSTKGKTSIPSNNLFEILRNGLFVNVFIAFFVFFYLMVS